MLRGSSSFSHFPRRSETLRVAGGHTQSSPQSARSIVTKTRTPGQCPATPRSLNIRERVRRAVRHDSPDVVKQLLNELIDRIDVSPDKHAQPYFWVPDVKRPGPSLVRAASGTPVRTGPRHVEVAGIEPASSVASSGLLRAQCALPLLGPTGHAHTPV